MPDPTAKQLLEDLMGGTTSVWLLIAGFSFSLAFGIKLIYSIMNSFRFGEEDDLPIYVVPCQEPAAKDKTVQQLKHSNMDEVFYKLENLIEQGPFDDLKEMADYLADKGQIEASQELLKLREKGATSMGELEKSLSSLLPLMEVTQKFATYQISKEEFVNKWERYKEQGDS